MFFNKKTIFKPCLHILNTPIRVSLSYFWNFGSIIGVVLIRQLITGLFLVILYTRDASLSFIRIEYIMRETNSGWILRLLHFNGARLFFICLFLHIGRGIIFNSFRLWKVWTRGIFLFILVMGEALIGYVLPWGQISVWGACVITRLLRVIPFVGNTLVIWVWGGFVVNRATLGCLFILHYLLPFIILASILLHIIYLHEIGRSSNTGRRDSEFKIKLFPYFILKDLLNLTLFGTFITLSCLTPFYLGDCENFKEANLIRRPIHIQPEWYFLFVYAILRSIPNKIGGVTALILSLLFIWTLCLLPRSRQRNYSHIQALIFSWFVVTFIVLTFLGASPVEIPFIRIRQTFTRIYFILLFTIHSFWLLFW